MARLLIIGGGCRGRTLAREFADQGHAVRITTRSEAGRAAIEAAGAECWIGTPDRIGSLRNALAGVSVLCWLLATVPDPDLHGSRLAMMLTQTIDTTVRGIVYEAGGGERLVASAAAASSIPHAVLRADPAVPATWLPEARAAVLAMLAGGATEDRVQPIAPGG